MRGGPALGGPARTDMYRNEGTGAKPRCELSTRCRVGVQSQRTRLAPQAERARARALRDHSYRNRAARLLDWVRDAR